MAGTVSVPNTFIAATDAVAAEVNANFQSLVAFINNNMVHKDGTIPITPTSVQTVNGALTVTGTLTGNVTGNVTGNQSGGSIAATTLTASGDANFNSGTLFVDVSENRVGISDTSPSYKLDVAGAIRATGNVRAEADLYVGKNGGGDSRIYFYDDNSDATRVFFWDDSENRFHLAGNTNVQGTLNATDITGDSITLSAGAEINGVLNADSEIRIINGTQSSPALNFDSEQNTGIYQNAATQFALVANGGTGLIVAATTVNTAAPTISSTSGYNAVYRSNVYGTLVNFTSRAEVKENIVNVSASDAGAWIDALQPVTFNERWLQEGEEPADNKAWREADSQVGFIADDVFANPTTARFATIKDENGTLKPVSWRIENVLAAAVAEIKSLRARMEAVEAA